MIQTRRGLPFTAFATSILATFALWPGAVAAASCSGQSHDVALSSGAATPGSGTTATAFQFSVTYVDNAGCAPTSIAVVVDGAGPFPMTFKSGDLTSGATFARATTLPAGKHAYRFEAVSGSGAGERTVTLTAVSPAAVTVGSPVPKPPPVVTPPPAPTPAITQPPPAPVATPPPPASTTVAPTAGSPTAGASAGTGGVNDPTASSPPGSSSAGKVTAVGPPGSRSTGASHLVEHPADAAAPLPAELPSEDPGPLQELAVAGVGTALGLGLFLLLGMRLLGTGLAPRPMPLVGARAGSVAADQAIEVWAVPDQSAGTIAPVVESDVTGSWPGAREPMRFAAPPTKGVDRCRVVSRLVALRREPDELSWPHPDRLDSGDEVDVLRQDGPYCYVRTPHGMEGWVPGLTLSGVKASDPEPGADDGR